MKYKVGDKVRIRKDLVVDEHYDEWLFTKQMKEDIEANNYILTISKADIAYDEKTPVYNYEKDKDAHSPNWELTESMIEGLVELTDREKFEGWMRKLSSLKCEDKPWRAFNNIVTSDPDNKEYEATLKVISDYLFGAEKKKMTKAEIEAELGYEIDIVEE